MRFWIFGDARRVQKAMEREEKLVARENQEDALATAMFMLEAIRRNLSGVPGMPQPHTHATQNSWKLVAVGSDKNGYKFGVISYAPQINRLERGFVGTDASGRAIFQPPRPFIAPAVESATKFANARARQRQAQREKRINA